MKKLLLRFKIKQQFQWKSFSTITRTSTCSVKHHKNVKHPPWVMWQSNSCVCVTHSGQNQYISQVPFHYQFLSDITKPLLIGLVCSGGENIFFKYLKTIICIHVRKERILNIFYIKNTKSLNDFFEKIPQLFQTYRFCFDSKSKITQ